jgi:hypothetical protein
VKGFANLTRFATLLAKKSNILTPKSPKQICLYNWQQLFISHVDVWWAQYPQNIFFTFLAAYTSYQLIEKPCLILKEAFKRRILPER